MCGIMGYYSFGNTLPDKEKITNMFTLLETRGRDASGYAYIKNNKLSVNKAPVKSSELVNSAEWKELTLPKSMILHTRLKTQGTELNNGNNHPLFSKQGLCIVHNGMIHNDKEIFGRKSRDAEVDSESILYLLSTKGKGDKLKTLFDRIEGSFAVAVIDKTNPDKLILIKKDNPVVLYYNTDDDILYFCSERWIMQEALEIEKKSFRGFNLGEVNYHNYDMENNHVLIISKDGVESYKRYSPKAKWFNRAYQSYGADDESLITCPYCKSLTTYDNSKIFNTCEMCGLSIDEMDYEDIYT